MQFVRQLIKYGANEGIGTISIKSKTLLLFRFKLNISFLRLKMFEINGGSENKYRKINKFNLKHVWHKSWYLESAINCKLFTKIVRPHFLALARLHYFSISLLIFTENLKQKTAPTDTVIMLLYKVIQNLNE